MDAASSAINNLISSMPTAGQRKEDDDRPKPSEPFKDTNSASTAKAESKPNPPSTKKDTSATQPTPAPKPLSTSNSQKTGVTAAEPDPSSTSTDRDTSVTEDVAPAVEHTKITTKHQTREQEVVAKERHRDHYHTTIQPLKANEVRPEKHHDETAPTEYRSFDHDHTDAKAKAEEDRMGFANTTERGKTIESTTHEPSNVSEVVHHHLHETIQPVIEKEVIDPSVTHKTIPIHERHQDPSIDHGVTTNKPLSVDDFKNKLSGETHPTKVVSGDVVSE